MNCRNHALAAVFRLHRLLSSANLLLLHKLGVGAIVDDILAENRGSKDGVNLFGVDIANLAVQDEIVALGADVDGGLLSEEDEGEAVAILLLSSAKMG